jgi:hypothetical protein
MITEGYATGHPVVSRATLRVEYSDGQVREFDVPRPRLVQFTVQQPDRWMPDDYLFRIPPPSTTHRVEIILDAGTGHGSGVITITDPAGRAD